MSQSTILTAKDFTRLAFIRLKKYWYLIIIVTVLGGLLLAIHAKKSPTIYTSKAVIFSLTSTNDNPSATSALSMLLGAEATQNFSDETSINVLELAQSRAITEAVASTRVPSMGNKIIAALLIDDINNHRGLLHKKIIAPKKMDDLITFAALFIKNGLTASINKNSSFILSFSGRSEAMVKVISYELIDKISQFYINLKREKAKRDHEFAANKVDSLRRVMSSRDFRLIAMDKRTLFTNTEKMEYSVPTENLIQDKQLIRSQYTQAVINEQTATYKLQKDTPLLKVLDKPDPPYYEQRKSMILYTFLGLLAGFMGISGLIISRLLFRYTLQEVSRGLFGTSPSGTTTTTIA
ncbi:MAG: hypothetical protein ABIN97_14455 [Ginsengibacter sp.]